MEKWSNQCFVNGNSIPKPPNTPIAQYLADLRQAYADNKIDEDTYNRSVAQAVDAQFAAQTAGRTGGVELSIPAGGGSPQLAPKPAAPTLPPVPSATNKAPTRESSGPVAPAIGEVRKGYKYLGGNPADPKSWSKV